MTKVRAFWRIRTGRGAIFRIVIWNWTLALHIKFEQVLRPIRALNWSRQFFSQGSLVLLPPQKPISRNLNSTRIVDQPAKAGLALLSKYCNFYYLQHFCCQDWMNLLSSCWTWSWGSLNSFHCSPLASPHSPRTRLRRRGAAYTWIHWPSIVACRPDWKKIMNRRVKISEETRLWKASKGLTTGDSMAFWRLQLVLTLP